MPSRQGQMWLSWPRLCGRCKPHPCSCFTSSLFDLLAFHGEMRVSQHGVAHVSTLHQQFVYLVSKVLSHIALPNIGIFSTVLWRQQPVSAQVWSSSHNSKKGLFSLGLILYNLQFLPVESSVRGKTTISRHGLNQQSVIFIINLFSRATHNVDHVESCR